MKSNRFLWLVVVIVVLLLALPVSNLLVGLPSTSLSQMEIQDAVYAEAFGALSAKCVNCHTTEHQLPFYARLPIARGVIEKDMEEGLEHLDLKAALRPEADGPVSEVVLAKVEHQVVSEAMPPGRYRLLHWNGGLNDSEAEAVLAWIGKTREGNYAAADVSLSFRQEAVQPLPQSGDLDSLKVALGNKLFHDTRLSGDHSISCASCHGLDKGGTDRKQVSDGVGGARGNINSPTVYNSGFQFVQFWDGRAPTLEEQAKGPVANPVEMAAEWPVVIETLKEDGELLKEFEALYPEGITQENVVDAIATFERSLITPNSAFDKYLRGDSNALTEEEKQGYALFKSSGCQTCHVGKILGGQSFEKMGREADYFANRGGVQEPDYGRFNVTKEEADRHRFKVPTLRNIAVTAPYFHDGSTGDLAEVVEKMAYYEMGLRLSDREVEQIVRFLHTLTGEYQGRLLQ